MTHQHSRVLICMLGELLSEPAPKTDTTPGLIQKYEAAKLTVANCVSDVYTPWGHSAVKQLVQEKVPLKLWRKCSQLAATCQLCKAECAVLAAYTLVQRLEQALTSHAGTQTAAQTFCSNLTAAVAQQLQQSGLLEQLPALLFDAAHQLEAVAAVWPASAQPADKSRFESALRLRTSAQSALFAEGCAVGIGNLTMSVDKLLYSIPEASLSIGCVLAAENLVLVSWHYISMVLPDGQSHAHSSTGRGLSQCWQH